MGLIVMKNKGDAFIKPDTHYKLLFSKMDGRYPENHILNRVYNAQVRQ